MLAINAIKEREGVQSPESLLSEQDDGVGSLEIQVQPERLRSCRLPEVWAGMVYGLFFLPTAGQMNI